MDTKEALDLVEQCADWLAAELAAHPDDSGGKRQDFHDALRVVTLALDSHEDASTPAFDEIAKLCGCATWEYPGQVIRDVAQVVKDRDARMRDYNDTYAALSLAGVGIADGDRHLDPGERVAILAGQRDRWEREAGLANARTAEAEQARDDAVAHGLALCADVGRIAESMRTAQRAAGQNWMVSLVYNLSVIGALFAAFRAGDNFGFHMGEDSSQCDCQWTPRSGVPYEGSAPCKFDDHLEHRNEGPRGYLFDDPYLDADPEDV